MSDGPENKGNTVSNRIPVLNGKNPRNHNGHREQTIKHLWRKATHGRVTVKIQVSPTTEGAEPEVRTKFGYYPKADSPSLKEFARQLLCAPSGAVPEGEFETASRWFHNKRCNPSNPPLGIGSTRRKSKGKN